MKKGMITAMAVLAMLASCAKDDELSTSDGKMLTFNVNKLTSYETRAGLSANGKELTDLWMLDYQGGVLKQTIHQESSEAGFGTVSAYFSNGEHEIYFVASRGDGAVLDTEDHKITWAKVSDTFYKSLTVDVSRATSAINVTLSRATCKLKVSVDDDIPSDVQTMTIKTGSWYKGIDYIDGSAADMSQQNFDVDISDGTKTVGVFSISPEEWKTDVTVSIKTATKTESVTAENVPLYRNRETTLHGNLFGSQQGMVIGVDDSWGEEAEKQW
jgi:hypothetical protein